MNKIKKYLFSELYEMSSGISSTKDQAGHGAPFLSFSTVFNNYFLPKKLKDKMNTTSKEQETFSIKKGDIFVTRTSETIDELAMSCVALKDYPNATYSGFVKRLRPKTSGIVDDKFIAFYLRSKLFRKTMENNATMTLRASFNEDIFSFLSLYLPPYKEQVKIGKLLYSIEEKIQYNKKINDNLHQQLKFLYDYWFTQFDFPDENGKPYKSSGGLMLSNDKVSYKVPADWKVYSLFENPLTTIIKPGIDVFESKNYLATAEVDGTEISTGAVIDYENRESRANMQPTVNSIWFAKMKNSVKHLYLNKEMQELITNSILSTGFCGLQCTEENFEYVASFIEHSYFETLKDTLAHGATQEAVNNDDLSGIVFVVPPERILRLFHESTETMYSQISRNICENQELTQLRDWLLPILMNGQATLSD